jgi:hypothetical protein
MILGNVIKRQINLIIRLIDTLYILPQSGFNNSWSEIKSNIINRTKYASLVRLIIFMENNINDTNIIAKAIVDTHILPNPNICSMNLCL